MTLVLVLIVLKTVGMATSFRALRIKWHETGQVLFADVHVLSDSS